MTARTTATIIGFGVVGTATAAALARSGIDLKVVDPAKGYGTGPDKLATDWKFVCVPTPFERADGVKLEHVVDALVQCEGSAKRSAVAGQNRVVLRSTVPPGTTERLQEEAPALQLVHWPEFLTETSAVKDGMQPARTIVGYTDRSVQAAAQLLELLPPAPFTELVPAKVAEAAKYFANSFYAVKVAFANQFYELCQRAGIDYEAVRRCAEHDPMMAPFHLDVHHKGYRGFGGKCLPKDSETLLDVANELDSELSLLTVAVRYNESLRDEGDGTRR